MATTSDDGFHEIQLNGKQLVFLFMAVTVVSVVIFLCGVLVGRGVATARGVAEPAPLEAVELEAPSEGLTAAAAGPGNAPATAREDLSYPGILGGGAQAPETLQEAVPPQSPVTESAAEVAPPARVTESAVEVAPPARPAPAPAAAPASAVAGEPAGSGFAIQVAALRDRTEADAVARRLSTLGYPAYVLPPAAGTPRVFRVRVGKYPERREAETVAARLEQEEQFKPWITR
jgi:cell division septation protein DedD